MTAENTDLGKIEKKVDDLAQELAEVRKELKSLSAVEGVLGDISKQISQLERLDLIIKSLTVLTNAIKNTANSDDLTAVSTKLEKIEESLNKSNDNESIISRLDNVLDKIQNIEPTIQSSNENSGTEDLNKNIEDIKESVAILATGFSQTNDSDSSDVVGRKIDDLQQYIAGLSSLEETIENLSSSFTETQEIVGIIVRQLDDIERKYNKSVEEINFAVATMSKLAEDIKSTPVHVTPEEKPTKPTKKEPPIGAPLPDTVPDLIEYLLEMVTPQTEAITMADTLERVRDKITTMIKGHTPVLFQFGKLSRELKSYPPTATLNENDIARLSKEIRGWGSKLEEMAKKE